MRLDLAGNCLARPVQSNAVTDPKDRAAILTEFSVILAAIFWGTNFAATKFAALSIPPLLLVAFRFCAGGLLMYGVLRLLEPESRLGGTAQTGFTFGLSTTSAASTGLIFSTAPVWGMLLGSVLGHERPTGRGVVGVALSIVGVGVVFYEGLGAGSTSLMGNLWVLLAAVSVGVYTVLSVPLLERHTPLTVATYPILFGGPFVLLLSSPELLNLGWGSVGVGVWASVGYSAVFATAFAFVGWQRGISRIGANRTLIYQYLITAVGVASGIVFFGERLGVEKVVGGAVILLGVYLARRQ